MIRPLFFLLVVSVLVSCNQFSGNDLKANKNFNAEVIYGEDNRIDWFQEEDPHWRQLALSTVALFDKDHLLESSNPSFYTLDTVPYGLSKLLCEDEPFYDQSRGSFCSGFLIGPDTVVTAGHCIRNSFNCENVRLVFDYHYADAASAPTSIDKNNVYQCLEVVHTQANALTGSDFAILKLKRKVEDRFPLPIRSNGDIEDNSSLSVIGYPSGLPLKIAHQGQLRRLETSYFVASLDTYGGNSGSAVFNSETRLVEGILVNGDTDFVFDPDKGCRVSNHCKESECRGEDVTKISEILPYITPDDLL